MEKIITRSDARALGATSYFTGKPCKNGHISYRYVQSGTCAMCVRDSNLSMTSPFKLAKLEELKARILENEKRNAAKLELVRTRFRIYDEDRSTFSQLAWTFTSMRYPCLLECDVNLNSPSTDRQFDSGMCAYEVHPDDIGLLRSLANDLFLLQTRKFSISKISDSKAENSQVTFVDTTPPMNFN